MEDLGWVASWLGGWVAGSMIIVPILAPSCKLKLARFSAKLRIQDGAECGNMFIVIYYEVIKRKPLEHGKRASGSKHYFYHICIKLISACIIIN